jgi:hypothetical protein
MFNNGVSYEERKGQEKREIVIETGYEIDVKKGIDHRLEQRD